MKRSISNRRDRRQGGGALLVSLVVVLFLTGLATAVFTMSLAHNQEIGSAGSRMRALYMAEAGVSESLTRISVAQIEGTTMPVDIGTQEDPMGTHRGRYWASVGDNPDGTWSVTSTGSDGFARRTIQVVVQRGGESVFEHAVFAGNSSGDPNYVLEFSGTGGDADSVTGDVYSGGDVDFADDSSATGNVVASGTISGGMGTEGETRQPPDIVGMDYANNNDFDVAAMFTADEEWVTGSDRGGDAWQLAEVNPAHIFRKNPTDRPDEINGTTKDDFFLEDPYGPLKDFTPSYYTSNEGHTITLSGVDGAPGVSGNDKVYYIDGNLWIHNKPFGRLRFKNDGPDGAKVTFVVKGNIYFSDDVLVADHDADGVAFIAIKDPAEPDSGNIFLGDPIYGTVERLEAFLYAENDFYDYNLDESGSKDVTIMGNMSAGNHVSIERDFDDGAGGTVHSTLTVEFDPRISALDLPGLPDAVASGVRGFRIVFWREIPTN